ncbi:hypothetical protein C5F51_22480 [Nocardia nova]|uniref:Uncharacterized protein n=1 Tax=Nocardia nova TaxID=37330 RepID=A0A2S6A205_9NOCA|nr:hypothetical protein C5F51_22480 [Nocardia nova]
MREIPYCFDCWPGGPVTPPPCRRCLSRTDYYTSGLCARCHPDAPGARTPDRLLPYPVVPVVDSCPDCHAWGVMRTDRWICAGCRSWRENHPRIADCLTCGRRVAVADDGSCRLCHKQRGLLARQLGCRPSKFDLSEANRYGQQLFFAGIWRREGSGRRPYIPKAVPADQSLLRPTLYQQLTLLELPRDLSVGRARGFLPPPDAARAAAWQEFVGEHATRHGWGTAVTEKVQKAIRILLGTQDTPGAAIRASDVLVMSSIRLPIRPVLEVLTAAGMLADDRVPPIDRWFDTQTGMLPEQMRLELNVWFDIARHGSSTPPRFRPRAETTIKSQLAFALPTLRAWATTHESLREIGRDDVLAALPADARARSSVLQGLRSIFRILKARKLVFVNPTARVSVAKPHPTAPDPINLDQLRSALTSPDPTCAALAGLLAFHAVRVRQLIALQVSDIRDGRLHLPDRIVPLAEPVRQRMTAYLDYRQQNWPATANPHLFIHYRNANTTTPTTPWWIRKRLGMTAQSIRMDRILEEAHSTGGDIRRLCDLFGLSIAGAYRYTTMVDHPAVAEYEPPRQRPLR